MQIEFLLIRKQQRSVDMLLKKVKQSSYFQRLVLKVVHLCTMVKLKSLLYTIYFIYFSKDSDLIIKGLILLSLFHKVKKFFKSI